MEKVDLAIVGAGAAGLMAAWSAVNSIEGSGLSVRLFERREKSGRKLLAAGNGRCNLGHSGPLAGHYRGQDPNFVLPVFTLVPEEDYRRIFLDLGVPLLEDEAGRLYPRTMRSDTVSNALLNALTARSVRIDCGLEVYEIRPDASTEGNGFILSFRSNTGASKDKKARSTKENIQGQIRARRVIIASGGKSQPQLSGHDSGYFLAESLGHSCTELLPALVPLELDDVGAWKRASGQRVRASAYYSSRSGQASSGSEGEFLFTDYGVSGIAAMELSEAVAKDRSEIKGDLIFDLCPDFSEEELSKFILRQIELHPEYDWEALLLGLLPLNLLIILLRDLKADDKIEKSEKGAKYMAGVLKEVKRPVRGTRGFDFAQVTAGGIKTAEIDPESLESKICPSLYLVGEILDVNGDTGGYNLRWAFSSAYVAGKNVASSLLERN